MWMGVCTAFVFAALVEFTCVNYLWRKTSMSRPRYALNSQGLCPTNGHNPQGQAGETAASGTSQEIVELNLVRFFLTCIQKCFCMFSKKNELQFEFGDRLYYGKKRFAFL